MKKLYIFLITILFSSISSFAQSTDLIFQGYHFGRDSAQNYTAANQTSRGNVENEINIVVPQNQVWVLSYSALTMVSDLYGININGNDKLCNCVKLDDMVMNRIIGEKNAPTEIPNSGYGLVPGTYSYSTNGIGSGKSLSGAFTDYFDQRLIMNSGTHKLKMEFEVYRYNVFPWPPVTQYDAYFIHTYAFEKYSLN